MNLNYKLLGKRIKQVRLNQNITQEKLAESVGVSAVYISHIESGTSKPSLETLVKICNVLGTTPDFVLLNSIFSSKEHLTDEIANLLKQCSTKEMNLILDLIKAVLENNKNI